MPPLAPYSPATAPARALSRQTLLDVATVLTEQGDGVDRHAFAAGIEFRPAIAGDAVVLDPHGTSPLTRDEGTPTPDRIADAVFLLDAALVAPAAGADFTALQAECTQALNEGQAFRLERQLWTGAGYETPADVAHQSLTEGTVAGDGGTTPNVAPTELNGGAAFAAGEGLAGILDGIAALGDGCRRVIHAMPSVVNGWVTSSEVVLDDGQLWTTVGGHLVLPGSGYPGTSPAGAAPAAGTSWVYVTHRPVVWLGNDEPHVDPGGAHARNGRTAEGFVRVWVQRPAIVAFDPTGHLAALVTK